MYISVNDPKSFKYEVEDILSGAIIQGVQEADDITGDFKIIMRDLVTGEWILDEFKNVAIFEFNGFIKIVKKGRKNGKK